jgi:hypothetical protein
VPREALVAIDGNGDKFAARDRKLTSHPNTILLASKNHFLAFDPVPAGTKL